MAPSFTDDESIDANVQANLGPKAEDFVAGKVTARIINKPDAPLSKTDYMLVVELLGSETSNQRCGADIVTVLDVSGSMEGTKLEKLKLSMKFLVKKLSPIDRLSVVSFSSNAQRLIPLLAMNESSQDKVEKLIDGLQAGGGTNITGGLEMALQVLKDRRVTEKRTCAIMLMSDAQQSHGYADPTTVQSGGVPVHTFGLGDDHDAEVLRGISKNSNNGTYSVADVEGSDSASLNVAFATCLAGLLDVVVQDLELTITQVDDSEVKEVRVGSYNKSKKGDSETISYGNLYAGEKRKAIVQLELPAVKKRTSTDILRITYSYRPSGGGELFEAPPLYSTVTRTNTPISIEMEEVTNENARQNTADNMKKARLLADDQKFDDAKNTLQNATKSLVDLEGEANELIKALKYEVEEFMRLLKDPETYRTKGRPFALSSELSHDLQRFAARGDATQLLAFAIPLAVVFAEQAKAFDKDPTIAVPTVEVDKKRAAEIVNQRAPEPEVPIANPQGLAVLEANIVDTVTGFVNQNLQQAVRSFNAVLAKVVTLCSRG